MNRGADGVYEGGGSGTRPLETAPSSRGSVMAAYISERQICSRDSGRSLFLLAADGIHGSRRRGEQRAVNLMAAPFAPDCRPDGRNQFVVVARPQELRYIEFFAGKQAIPQFAVGCQAQAIAVEAEGTAYGSNETNSATAIRIFVLRGGRARVGIGNGQQRPELRLDHRDHVVGCEHTRARPEVLRIERHEFDVPDFEIMFPSETGQRHDILLG